MRPLLLALSALLSTGAVSHAQSEKTWLYIAANSGGVAWNLTDLKFDQAQDMYQGTMMYYSPTATPINGHNVHWVLEDFDMGCAQVSYVSVSSILYNQDMVAVETLFEPTPAVMDETSVYRLLHHVLCNGGTVTDFPILEAGSAKEAMQSMALTRPQ
jgi:hypothetical protein